MSRPGLLADENVARSLVEALRKAGWDVAYVSEQRPGIPDRAVVAWAQGEDRILVTEDKDFGDFVFRMREPIPGVLLLRLPEASGGGRWSRLEKVLAQHEERLVGRFTVVGPANVRARPLG